MCSNFTTFGLGVLTGIGITCLGCLLCRCCKSCKKHCGCHRNGQENTDTEQP